jgi:Zn-dependent protease with chaperone function
MSDFPLYPISPSDVPKGLTRAKGSYKRQAWLAMSGLLAFIVLYLALAGCFALIFYNNLNSIITGDSDLFHIVTAGISLLLTVFMIKSIFTVRKSDSPEGVEVTAQDEPKLFEFLHRLADEISAPKPYRVFITPDVDAAVFYDLSLINLIFPSKKNLIIGLGLVNVLNLGELKAVLAHEFGHFSQGSMAVGRWVYIAQQIISHMVATRDWLDTIVHFISRFDLRVAWIGWILSLVIWSIRSLMDTLFRLVIIAERALSREMEFNADLVAVSVTGSDALVNALHKLQAADEAWQTTLDVAGSEAGNGKRINDLFSAQQKTVIAIGQVLNDPEYGVVPEVKCDDISQHRVFSEQEARPPQMWSTHPANRDREDNVKSIYISADIDNRSSWLVFYDPEELRKKISHSFYNEESVADMEAISAEDAVTQRFNKASFSSRYRGTYMSRSPVRNFSSVDEILQSAELTNVTVEILENLYPDSIAEKLEMARSLDSELHTLQALSAGDIKPSGGVFRHRGTELKKSDIPDVLEQVIRERSEVAATLKIHDANCRKAHLLAAKKLGKGWKDYLMGLIRLLHCTEHLRAIINNEQALLVNTWNVITADGKVGYFEKRRMLKVCQSTQETMRTISSYVNQIEIPVSITTDTGINDWNEQCPKFDITDIDKKNWFDWVKVASQIMDNLDYAIGLVQSSTLEELINSEAIVAKYFADGIALESAPSTGNCPVDYPVLLPGNEHVLPRKLDLWNRFQLAHGFMPTMLRLLVSLGIVGGTIYSGIVGFNI